MRTDPLRLLAEAAKWRKALESAHCVVHLAAHVHQMGADSDGDAAYTEINVEGSRFAAEQAARAGVRRFVYLSSVKVNGEGGGLPYRPTDYPDPSGIYGRSKLAAEAAIREVCESSNMQYVIIRPPLVFGPGVKANFRRLLQWVDRGVPLPFRSVENRRSMIGLTNLVNFIELCMLHQDAQKKVWLIADDDPVSTPALLRKIANLMNCRSRLYSFPPAWLRALAGPLRLGDQISRLCDSLLVDASAARIELGWRPLSSFDEELARTVAAYQAQKNR